MISAAYRTSLEMFCDVKLHFGFYFSNKKKKKKHFGVLDTMWDKGIKDTYS